MNGNFIKCLRIKNLRGRMKQRQQSLPYQFYNDVTEVGAGGYVLW